MVGTLGHAGLIWSLEGLEIESLRSVRLVSYAYMTNLPHPGENLCTPQLQWASLLAVPHACCPMSLLGE